MGLFCQVLYYSPSCLLLSQPKVPERPKKAALGAPISCAPRTEKGLTTKSSPLSFGLGVFNIFEDSSGYQVDRVLNEREYSGNADVGVWIDYPGPSCAEVFLPEMIVFPEG